MKILDVGFLGFFSPSLLWIHFVGHWFSRFLSFSLSLFYTNDVERVFSASTTVSLSQLNAFHCASIINVIIISLARFPSLSFSLLYIARSIYLSIFRCLHYRSLSLSRSRSNETMRLMPTVVNERVRECVCEYSLFLSPVK